jgi:hypothetical protein
MLILLVFAGCGGGGGPAVPYEDAREELVRAGCQKLLHCCSSAELEIVGDHSSGPFADQASCELQIDATLDRLFFDLDESVGAGRIGYDGARVRECVDAALTCEPDNLYGARCDGAFVGKVAPGGRCALDNDCAGGGWCQGVGGTGAADGRCAERPAAGEACPDLVCAEGNYCKDFACAPLEAEGAACIDSHDCQPQHTCEHDQVDQPGVCTPEQPFCDGV